MPINQITFSNLLLILSVNNPTRCILAISECISKQKCISEQPEVGWRSTQKKMVDYANTTDVEFNVDPKGLFHG